MKIKLLLFLFAYFVVSHVVYSQQALGPTSEIVSPEVNDDNSVTFRLWANKAKDVKLVGDWMPSKNWIPGTEQMNVGANSIWTLTVKDLPSDLYGYSFVVDGVKINDPNNVYSIRDVGTVTSVFIVGKGKADLYKVNNVPHGSVTRCWYQSPTNHISPRRITIYTPPGYEKTKQKYPVLYLLHGMGGDEEAWIALGRASQIMDNLIAQGKATPMIVVMTNGNVAQEAAPGESSLGFYKPSFQLPHTMDGRFESTFPDVIKFVESNYRVVNNKSGRAIAGLSMGGFHSLYTSANYPNTFDYVGLFSAAIFASKEKEQDSKIYQDLESKLKKQKENGYKLYWLGMGKTDFLYQPLQDYKGILDKINMPYTYHESEGGHTWTNWRDYLSTFAPMLFK